MYIVDVAKLMEKLIFTVHLSFGRLCSSLENNEEDIAHLQGILATVVSSAVENGQDGYVSISSVCDIMNKQHISPVVINLSSYPLV